MQRAASQSRRPFFLGFAQGHPISPSQTLSLPIQVKKEYLAFDSPSGPGRQVSKEGTIEDVLKLLDF